MMNEPLQISIVGGTGSQGLGLALRWARAGCSIIIGSRDQSRAEAAASHVRSIIGDVSIKGLENSDAVNASSISVLSVPFASQLATLKSVKGAFKAGDLLIDMTVPLETAVGGRANRLLGVWAGSAAEQAVSAVPSGVAVVSAFHNVSSVTLQDLDKNVDSDIIVCGDESASKARVRTLVELVKDCRYIDGGPLANSRLVEAITALLISINSRYKAHTGIRLTGLPSQARS
jgi:NADPH-dependent F420 reductase